MIKLGDMVQWCELNKEFPTDVDEAFVFNIETSAPGQELSFVDVVACKDGLH